MYLPEGWARRLVNARWKGCHSTYFEASRSISRTMHMNASLRTWTWSFTLYRRYAECDAGASDRQIAGERQFGALCSRINHLTSGLSSMQGTNALLESPTGTGKTLCLVSGHSIGGALRHARPRSIGELLSLSLLYCLPSYLLHVLLKGHLPLPVIQLPPQKLQNKLRTPR